MAVFPPSLVRAIDELNAGARRPAAIPATKLQTIGILGAGFMGAGIATVSARAGFDVILIDRDQVLADRGKAMCASWIARQIAKGDAQPADEEALLARIFASADAANLANCDLIIESVFEDRGVKAMALQKAQAAAPKGAIFGSNTSTFPITSLAGACERPEDFLGIHFFSPVPKMALVELVLGQKTSARALAAAFDYARAIGKTPIVVNDGYEFFANRCVNRFLREGHLMLLEGVPPALIETAAQQAGMPVGPLALSDEVGVDLVFKILQVMKEDLGAASIDARQDKLLETMIVLHGRTGRKSRKGFYDYPENQPKTLWPGLSGLQPEKRDLDARDIEDLKLRFLAIQALETVRAVEAGIIVDPREADVGSVLGFGFPPHTGGVLSYIDTMGTRAFLSVCERLALSCGDRFSLPQLLKDMAAGDEGFYEHCNKGFG